MDNRAIHRKHLEALTSGDWATYKSFFTADAVYEEEATQRVFKGPDEVANIARSWREAFPDLKATIKNSLATGDAVIAEIEWEGTHKGTLQSPMGTIPASGRRGKVAAIQVLRFESGKIREARHYFDLMTVLAQIGALPRQAAAAAP